MRQYPLLISLSLCLAACATTQSRTAIKSEPVISITTQFAQAKTPVIVGKINNQSGYMQGIFSGNENQLSEQAQVILSSKLQQTQRYAVLDRQLLQQNKQEAERLGRKQNIDGARYSIVGSVTEFGRKEVGDQQLFGILGAGKSQIAYSKFTLQVVDVLTSQVVYSTEAAGEYQLSEREVLGFGSRSSYDSTLNGKVLSFAITQAVNNLVLEFEGDR
jgi:curli biogenesis system outer membrane secretion channel CsgG